MRKFLCFFSFFSLLAIFVLPRVANAYVEKNTAVVRIMNKAAGKAQSVSIIVGQTFQYDGLTMVVRNCKQSDPFDAENFFAFVEIYTKADGRIFSGWMNRNEPGQNPLQDDTYDVWLEKCE
jgi:hypothetical protein